MVDKDREKFVDAGNERAVIAAVLCDADLLIDVQAKLSESDFLSDHHRALYSVLNHLASEGAKSFDLMAIVDVAEKKKLLSSIDDVEYIKALQRTPVDGQNLSIYVNKVLDASTKYKVYSQAKYIQQDALQSMEEEASSESLIAKSEARLLDISMSSKRIEDAVDISMGLRDRIADLAANPVEVKGITSGIPILDDALNGFQDGTLTILAARQKVGKSTLLMNIASHMCFDLGLPILYIDTEMSTPEVQTRLLSHVSAVPERSIVNGKFVTNDSYCRRVDKGLAALESGLLLHRYFPGFTVDGLSSLVRKYHARNGIAAVFFDYIKLPENGGKDSKESQELGKVTTSLKDLAGTLSIPVISAAQIKRQSNEKGAQKSLFHDSDVADSDKIGRYCNNLLALGRKTPAEIEEDGIICGTHRLQILLARGGGTLFRGIDLASNLPTLTFTQAKQQSNGIPNFDGDR